MENVRIFGYCDPLSVRAGERVDFMVSAEGTTRVEAQLVRLIHGDEHPDGPGYLDAPVASPVDGALAVARQFTQVGSFAQVADPAGRLAPDGAFSGFAFIWPTTPGGRSQTLLGRWDAARVSGYRFGIDAQGRLELALGDGISVAHLLGEVPLFARCWYLVGFSHDPASGETRLYQEAVINASNSLHAPILPYDYAERRAGVLTQAILHLPDTPFVLAGSHRPGTPAQVVDLYNGKIDRCGLVGRALDAAAFDAIRRDADGLPAREPQLLAYWNPSIGYGPAGIGDTLVDQGPAALDLEGFNRPVRAMTGYNWSGRDDSYRLAPEQYGGVHFHDDALIDCRWTPACSLEVPADLPSGCYALKLRHGGVEEHIPFFVRAASPRAPIAVLMATASYLAYANEQLSFSSPVVQPIFGRTPILSEDDMIRVERPELGLSAYDCHSDGAGVCFSSWRRPILNMRPRYRMALGSTWQFPADLSMIAWLTHKGYDYEVLTDHDLHRDGLAALAPYKAVITGSHPEYYSWRMMDATEQYLGGGGRLIYTGANGYYWAVSFRDDEPWCMEVRKLDSGSRAWQAQPGEHYNQSEPIRSGLWRNIGRTPQKLLGVGFATEGFDASGSYSRMPDADKPELEWIMAGVPETLIGDFGLALGGAAGLELDRYDLHLGTPPGAYLLATSQGLSDNYPRVSEEIYYMFPGQGATQDYQCRADVVFFDTLNDGAVFSTGSIAWTSALPSRGFDNPVSRITANVLDAFIRPGPLPGRAARP